MLFLFMAESKGIFDVKKNVYRTFYGTFLVIENNIPSAFLHWEVFVGHLLNDVPFISKAAGY